MDFQLNKIALHTLLLPPAEERTTPPNSLCSLAAGWYLQWPLGLRPGCPETTGTMWGQTLCSAGLGTLSDVEKDSPITLFPCESVI